MTSPTLTGLPVELRSSILDHLSSLSDLAALFRTCTAYYDVYAKSPAKYMSKIAVKQLVDDGGNLRDALAAVWSYSRLTRTTEKEVYEGEYKATAIAFLDMCRRAEETHYFDINDDELPIHESLALVKLQKTADYLIDDFLDWVDEDEPIRLTSSERRRIRRAIYRWQIYRNVFIGYKGPQGFYYVDDVDRRIGGDPNAVASSLFSIELQQGLYAPYLYPWESEEMKVIYDYAMSRYVGVLKRVEPVISSKTHAERSYEEQRVVGEWLENLVAQGPDLLCQAQAQMRLSEADPQVLSELAGEHRQGRPNVWFMDMINGLISELQVGDYSAFDSDPDTRPRLCFEGDDVAESPNAGWVIAHEGEVEMRSGTDNTRQLRRFGYVFWDVERFRPGADFDLNVVEDLNYDTGHLENMLAPANTPLAERRLRLP